MWKSIEEYPENRIFPGQSVTRTVSANGHRFDIVYEQVTLFSAIMKSKSSGDSYSGGEETMQSAVCYDGKVVSRLTTVASISIGNAEGTGAAFTMEIIDAWTHNFEVEEDGVNTHYTVGIFGHPERPGFEITRNHNELVAIIPQGK